MAETIRDMQGNVIGYQDRDGTLRDRNKKKIGYIKLRDGTVFDEHNQEVGFIDKEGTVVDRYRRRLGSIGNDGVVQDWHGVQIYTGSAAPLLLDFENIKSDEPVVVKSDFDQMARAKPMPGRPGFEEAAEESLHGTEPSRPRILMREGFVSPAVGCAGIVGALLVSGLILFLFQNPSFITGGKATPTASLVAGATSVPGGADADGAGARNPTGAPTTQAVTGTVNVDILNLRKGPTTDFDIVDRLPVDTEIELVGRLSDSSWLQVKVASSAKEGWVAAQYVTTDADLSTLPVVEPPSQ